MENPQPTTPEPTSGKKIVVILAPKTMADLVNQAKQQMTPAEATKRVKDISQKDISTFDADPKFIQRVKNIPITEPPITKPPPPVVITRTPYPKWWKDARAWAIQLVDAGTATVIGPTPGYRTYISTIVLTVSGETIITFGMGVFGSSGQMRFGGTDEPRGIVIAMGDSPLPLGGGGFTITSSGPGVNVGGFISYYYEQE
jgi:hypothetical protein